MKTRIIHNGIKYRVQVFRRYRFLWFRWQKWRTLYRQGYSPYTTDLVLAEFYTLDDAEAARDKYLKDELPRQWEIVKEDGE